MRRKLKGSESKIDRKCELTGEKKVKSDIEVPRGVRRTNGQTEE